MTVVVRLALPYVLLLVAASRPAQGVETNRSRARPTPTNSMDWVQRGNADFRSGQRSNAIYCFTQAIALNPTNAIAYYNRGRIQDVEGLSTNALADLNRLLEINPDHPGGCQHRGAIHLRLGALDQALADYDHYLKLSPKAEASHWQRGIAYYLLGRYEDGRRQFGMCYRIDTNDVEHALWHFLCVAKIDGAEKARQMLLKVGQDRRAILRDVYALFAGKSTPEAVLKAAEEDADKHTPLEQRRFFAQYYVGQYYEALGDVRRSIEHLSKAAVLKPPDRLMPDVARVQVKLRQAELAR